MPESESILMGLAIVFVLGIGVQWLAWRLKWPSILLLLIGGFMAGPVLGLVQPDQMLGELLIPLVSISVGLILFEGGMSLRLAELRQCGRSILALISVGALAGWLLNTAGARWILGLEGSIALVVGAILVVTGPTVVGPLLRQMNLRGRLAAVAKWEGIMIDPVGAVLAVLVFEAVVAIKPSGLGGVFMQAGAGMVATLLIGVLVGVPLVALALFLMHRFWIPDYLESPLLVALVLAALALSNHFQADAGLFTVTLMGFLMANQRWAPVRHVVEFKENLRVLLISALFILLAARLDVQDLFALGWRAGLFIGFLIVIVRPIVVWLSTLGSELDRQERILLALLAPRGIVAAAVASVFALRLGEPGEVLVSVVFAVIVATVAFYGLVSPFVASWLGVAEPNPQGVLFAGANPVGRAMAQALKDEKLPVRLIDNNWSLVREARMAGLPAEYGNVLSEHALEEMDLSGLGHLLALTPNDELNSLAVLHFSQIFGRVHTYQLTNNRADPQSASEGLKGRVAFQPPQTFNEMLRRLHLGWVVKTVNLGEEFPYASFRDRYGPEAILLFELDADRNLRVADMNSDPQPGATLIALVEPVAETAS